jgi:hypothetical protein
MRHAAQATSCWPDLRLSVLGALALTLTVEAEEEALEIAVWGDWLRDPHRSQQPGM